jgi:hypothetical protein
VLFRAVNEKITVLNEAFAELAGSFAIACECSRTDCVEMLELTPDAYAAVRESPRTFAVLRGHAEPGIDRVVSVHEGYAIVEVVGSGAQVAEATFRGGRTAVASG